MNKYILDNHKVRATFIKEYDCWFFKIPKGLTVDAYYILPERLLIFYLGNYQYQLPFAEEYFEIKERY